MLNNLIDPFQFTGFTGQNLSGSCVVYQFYVHKIELSWKTGDTSETGNNLFLFGLIIASRKNGNVENVGNIERTAGNGKA